MKQNADVPIVVADLVVAVAVNEGRIKRGIKIVGPGLQAVFSYLGKAEVTVFGKLTRSRRRQYQTEKTFFGLNHGLPQKELR